LEQKFWVGGAVVGWEGGTIGGAGGGRGGTYLLAGASLLMAPPTAPPTAEIRAK